MMKAMNRTTFLRQEEVADGYNGKKTVGFLCYDPEVQDIIAVYPFGWCRLRLSPVESAEYAT